MGDYQDTLNASGSPRIGRPNRAVTIQPLGRMTPPPVREPIDTTRVSDSPERVGIGPPVDAAKAVWEDSAGAESPEAAYYRVTGRWARDD